MAYTNPQNPDCQNCNKAGLAILPVRYAVVPADVKASLPAPLGNKVSDIKLAHHRYALRTLRQGFVYILHEKHPRGSHIKWEVYSVSPQGTLWKQLSASAVKPVVDEPACSGNIGHNIPTSIIHIDKPEKCKRIWIAFSEHAWSEDTFKLFETDAKLRDQRMQTFLPSTWIKARGYRHGLEATQANIEQVIEYKSDFDTANLTGNEPGNISQEDGTYHAIKLKKNSTRYPLHMRKAQSKKVANAMQRIGENPKEDYPGIVIALWDAVGITHELNGFRNDAAGWIEKYGKERELELTAMNAIEGVKKALEDKAVNNEKQRQEDTRNHAPQIDPTTERRARAAKLAEPKRSQELEVCDIRDSWTQRQLPMTLGFGMRLDHANLFPEPARNAEIAKIKADAERFLTQRAKNGPEQIELARKHAWSEYEEKLDKPAYDKFKQKYDAFLVAADKLIDDRTDDLIAWLESKWIINAFTEFHQSNVDDGVVFDDQVGTAIFGMNSSVKGKALIDAWVKEMKATESNLLWRALALNQKEGMEEVNGAMAAAAAYTAPVGQLAVDFLTKHVRKWADMYKKANTMQNTVIKAGDAAERIKKIKVTDFDRLFMTAGDRLFKPFLQRGVDTGAEFAVRGLVLARAGAEPDRILDALKTQAKQEGLARASIVRRLQTAKTFIGSGKDLKDAKYAELQKKWLDLKANPTKGATALKENRLSLIVATLEIVNLTKIAWEFKQDKRTYGELAAAACSATAAVADIAANAAKHLVGDKVSVTFQKLKVFGGVLSAGAGYYSMVQEWDNAEKARGQEYYAIATAYYFKVGLQFSSATLGLLSSVSYAAPLLEASGSKTAQWVGGRLLFYRLFCMTWAVRLNMVGLAITAFVWILTPNPLKEWCKECPFGLQKRKGTKDSKKLIEELGESLQDIL